MFPSISKLTNLVPLPEVHHTQLRMVSCEQQATNSSANIASPLMAVQHTRSFQNNNVSPGQNVTTITAPSQRKCVIDCFRLHQSTEKSLVNSSDERLNSRTNWTDFVDESLVRRSVARNFTIGNNHSISDKKRRSAFSETRNLQSEILSNWMQHDLNHNITSNCEHRPTAARNR